MPELTPPTNLKLSSEEPGVRLTWEHNPMSPGRYRIMCYDEKDVLVYNAVTLDTTAYIFPSERMKKFTVRYEFDGQVSASLTVLNTQPTTVPQQDTFPSPTSTFKGKPLGITIFPNRVLEVVKVSGEKYEVYHNGDLWQTNRTILSQSAPYMFRPTLLETLEALSV